MTLQHHPEPARETPIVREADVVVAGGGPAGVAAALAAARGGASVVLIESHGQLGGVWTTGLLSWIIDAGNKDGIMAEVLQRLDALDARQPDIKGGVAYDTEAMKLVLEQACVEAGVTIRLHTHVVAASRDSNNRLAVCITESKSGREAWAGKCFIDCTGDGDLAAQAGCGFDIGRPKEGPGSAGPDRAGETQPMTLMALITGIDHDATAAFHERRDRNWNAPKDALLAEFERAGATPSYGKPTIFAIRPGLYTWMINHEYGVDALDAQQISDATIHARHEVHTCIDALRSLGGVWENIQIVTTGSQLGVREGRRIHGRASVTLQDLIDGSRYDDAVCRATFCIDVHSTSKSHSTSFDHNDKVKTQPYDIPYGAIVAKDVDGLLLAGRCISGDFLAHSSYRVTGNSVALGESAGHAAAAAVSRDVLPHEIDFARDVLSASS
jgi:hypothetical protein